MRVCVCDAVGAINHPTEIEINIKRRKNEIFLFLSTHLRKDFSFVRLQIEKSFFSVKVVEKFVALIKIRAGNFSFFLYFLIKKFKSSNLTELSKLYMQRTQNILVENIKNSSIVST